MSPSSSISTSSVPRPRGASTVRTGVRAGEFVVSVQFGGWGPQEISVGPAAAAGAGECRTW